MKIRELQDNEIYDAENLIKEVFFAAGNLGMNHQDAQQYLEHLSSIGHDLHYLGAYDRALEGIIGYDPQTFALEYLYVRKEQQKQGNGKCLLEALKQKAEQQHIAKLTCEGLNQAAGFLAACGFEAIADSGKLSTSMEMLMQQEQLGNSVSVIIDHPIGTIPLDTPEEYACNVGCVKDNSDENAEPQVTYVIGPEEPVESFEGIVIGIVYRSDSIYSRWIVSETDHYDRSQVINLIGAQEQYHDTYILWL